MNLKENPGHLTHVSSGRYSVVVVDSDPCNRVCVAVIKLPFGAKGHQVFQWGGGRQGFFVGSTLVNTLLSTGSVGVLEHSHT